MPQELKKADSKRVDHVGRSGIYPVSGPWPSGDAPIVGQGELAHPEERRRKASWPSISRPAALAIGRAVFGGFFLYNGINHFLNRNMLVAYARSKQVPAADVAVMGSGALLVLGGLSLVTGVRPKWGASLISMFLAGVTPQMHAFWNIEDEPQRIQELVNFTKNVALIGGAAFAAAVPEPWPASVPVGGSGLPAA